MSTLFIFSNFFLFNPVRQAAVLFSCNLQTAEFNWIEAQGQAGVDLCMINGSKVLIYLTLLYFIFYGTLVTNAKGYVAKSNKSELLNRLSYRGLNYHFEVRRKSVRNDCKITRSQPQKFDLYFHSTSTTSKGPTENSKKMSWDNSVFPIDTKNSVVFFVQFFLS